MEGFAGFVGLMFGLVVLSVIITLVVCAVKRHRSRCSGFAITVRGVCGRGIAAVSDAVYSRAAIRSGCNRRFLSLYEY